MQVLVQDRERKTLRKESIMSPRPFRPLKPAHIVEYEKQQELKRQKKEDVMFIVEALIAGGGYDLEPEETVEVAFKLVETINKRLAEEKPYLDNSEYDYGHNVKHYMED